MAMTLPFPNLAGANLIVKRLRGKFRDAIFSQLSR
jgi:hypothetical protein